MEQAAALTGSASYEKYGHIEAERDSQAARTHKPPNATRRTAMKTNVDQVIKLSAPPVTELPRWGRRMMFDTFFVELVPRGKRVFNVRLEDTFASISYTGAKGTSSLAGDRVRRYERLPFEYIIAPPRFPLKGETRVAPEVLVFVVRFDALRPMLADAFDIDADQLQPSVIIGNPAPFTTELAKKLRIQLNLADPPSAYVEALCTTLLVEMFRPAFGQHRERREKSSRVTIDMLLSYIDANLNGDLNLERMAALAGISENQLSRRFKQGGRRVAVQLRHSASHGRLRGSC